MRTPTESEPKMKSVDAAVGPLVWVRRPNGRWWPGRILGADEVPENSSVSQKSGNPVKLFGNDDAKVHWINLETSTRLKSFRCGEFDDWIEKAKASSSRSSKKDSKYARREDAILQALELESGLQKRLFDVPVLREENKPAGVTPVSRIEQLSLKWQSKGKRRNRDKCLLDVYLEVHAGKSQGREHVPYISLASKTQGRLFTGHPITVEVLEDGACERMMRSYYASQGAVVHNKVKPDLVDTRPQKKRFTSSDSVGKSSKAKKKGKIQNLSRRGDKDHPSSKLSGSDIQHIIPVKVAMNRLLKALHRAGRRDNST